MQQRTITTEGLEGVCSRGDQMSKSFPNTGAQLSVTSGKHTGIFSLHKGVFLKHLLCAKHYSKLRGYEGQFSKTVPTPGGLTIKDQKTPGRLTSSMFTTKLLISL